MQGHFHLTRPGTNRGRSGSIPRCLSPSSWRARFPCSGRTCRPCSTCPAIWAATGSSSTSPTRPTLQRYLRLRMGADRQSRHRPARPAAGAADRARAGGEADRHADPAADRRRPALGRARGPWPGAADRPVRPALRLQLSLPVRLRELRAGDGARAARLRPVAAAGAAGQAAAARRPVRADLGASSGSSTPSAGGRSACSPSRPSWCASTTAADNFISSGFRAGLPLPGAGAAGGADAAVAQQCRRADTVDWFNWERKLDWLTDGAARPLGDVRHRLSLVPRPWLLLFCALVSRRLTFSRNLAASALFLLARLRAAAADRVRIGLCRHAAGALSVRRSR